MHVDVKEPAASPTAAGGTWRGRQQVGRNSRNHTTRRHHRHPVMVYGYVHAAVNDHSRAAYAEFLPDEQGATAARFLHRAQAWFAQARITVRRVLTDNGPCYRSHYWQQAMLTSGITHQQTRPHQPHTNGKVERFNRTLLRE